MYLLLRPEVSALGANALTSLVSRFSSLEMGELLECARILSVGRAGMDYARHKWTEEWVVVFIR